MSAVRTVAAHTRVPWRAFVADERHGPLPALLLALTVLTGIVDAVSILSLGRVFVANMTGNVVFIGFAITGAAGFSLIASLSALAGFLVGAFAAGRAIVDHAGNRALLLRDTLAGQLLMVAAAFVLAVLASGPLHTGVRAVIAALLAVALGMQNAAARKLAVPDLTTTVLTMTLTGIAADSARAGPAPAVTRRIVAVAAMLIGAIVGSALDLDAGPRAGLAAALGLLALVALAATLLARRPGAWQ